MSKSPKRTKIFFPRGFQLRFAFLVAGSLLVLLVFVGVHGLFIAEQGLSSEALESFKPILFKSTLRLFLVGFLYIVVVTVAATFLTHRTIGPAQRLVDEVDKIGASKNAPSKIQIREGDELETLVKAINNLIARLKR